MFFLKDKKVINQLLVFVTMLPLLFFIIGGFAQLVVMGTSHLVTEHAAFEAARVVADKSPTTLSAMRSIAESYSDDYGKKFLKDWVDRSSVAVSTTGYSPGQKVTVTIKYNFPKFGLYYMIPGRAASDFVSGTSTQVLEEVP